MEVDASLQQSLPATCKSYLLSLSAFIYLFSLGNGVCHLSATLSCRWQCKLHDPTPVEHCSSIQNRGAMFHRCWVDERGNPSSYEIIICVNQPLPGAEGWGERGEEQG